ncbi:hypothetical protein [Alteromonas sp. H39]|uniref:hypothetical protein n=1 Tax=Alteromonas sp. H39 TaxID=3389876 RepID=UPI0039DF5483
MDEKRVTLKGKLYHLAQLLEDCNLTRDNAQQLKYELLTTLSMLESVRHLQPEEH